MPKRPCKGWRNGSWLSARNLRRSFVFEPEMRACKLADT